MAHLRARAQSFCRRGCWLLVAILGLAGPPVRAAVVHEHTRIDGVTLDYDVVLPRAYEAGRAYPGILAFGGGPQTEEVDRHLIDSTLREQAERRGYIVIVPAAPDGVLFYNGSERLIPALLRHIRAAYRIKGGRFLVAGRSNGGISAFEVASFDPQDFLSVTGFPGYLLFPTEGHLTALSRLCIHLFVGERDELGFRDTMQQQAAAFRAHGLRVSYQVEPGQRHQIETLMGTGAARLFDVFDRDERQCVRKH